MELSCGNDAKFKVKIWPWPFHPKINRGLAPVQWWYLKHVLPVIWGATLLILGSRSNIEWLIFSATEPKASPLKPLNRIQQNFTGSKISTSPTKFVFFGPIGKTRWPPWPLVGWDIFDFSFETAERNSTKLDMQQDLNVLYQVYVFRVEKKQDGSPGLWLAETFSTSPLKPLNRIQWNLTGSKRSTSFTKFVFFVLIQKKKEGALASDWLKHFRLLLWNRWSEFKETWQEFNEDINILYQVCIFRADLKNKMAALASDWLRHFPLLLWNCWTEFNATWQEERYQHPLPNLCFFGPIGKRRWRPWPLISWDIFYFSSETAEPNSTKLDRKQNLNVIFLVCVFWADLKKQYGHPRLWLA